MHNFRVEKSTPRTRSKATAPRYDHGPYDELVSKIFTLDADDVAKLDVKTPAKNDSAWRPHPSGPYEASHAVDREISRLRAAAKRHDPPFQLRFTQPENPEDHSLVRNEDGTITVAVRKGKTS